MPIPKFHELMLPLLKHYGDGKVHTRYEFLDSLGIEFKLTPEELAERVSSGLTRVADRIGWATTFLKKAGLLIQPERGYHEITDRGQQTLKLGLDFLTPAKIVELYPDSKNNAFYNPLLREKHEFKDKIEELTLEGTPDEEIDTALANKELQTQSEIKDQVDKITPRQFENLVNKLLVAMGYGKEEYRTVTSYTNDGGIDGIIQADELGFEKIYIQAKKFQDGSSVGRPDIQKFVGAMTGTTKGVFITTAKFSSSVEEYLKSRSEKVILIDGPKLIRLMYKHNIGVSVRKTIDLKGLDSDFFDEL
ncbi:MAG: restriction endonuclease [bacterium]